MQRGKLSLSLLICLFLFELFFLTPLVFYGWATTFSMVKQTFAELGIILILFLFLFNVKDRIKFSLPSVTDIFIIIFASFLVLSLAWTSSLYASFTSLGVWASYFCIYFIARNIIKEEKWIRFLVIAVLFSGALSALYSIFQFYGIELPIWRRLTGRMRLFSTFGNPNYLAGYLAAALHLGILLFLVNKKWRYLFLIVTGILYTSLIITYTRGAWVSLFFSSLLVLLIFLLFKKNFLKEKRKDIFLLFLLLSCITLIFLYPNPLNRGKINLTQRAGSIVRIKSSASQRFLIWGATLELIKERPFLGWGVGNFRVYYPLGQGKFLSRKENKDYLPLTNRSINAHNDYLHICSEVGIVGGAIFIVIILSFYLRAFSFFRKNYKKTLSFIYLSLFTGALTSFLIHALVSFPFHIIQNGMVFWLLLGISDNILRGKIRWEENSKEGDKKESYLTLTFPHKSLRILFILLFAAFLFYLSWWRIKIFVSDLHVKQAELFMEAKLMPQAKKELEEAVKINPYNAEAFSCLTQIYSFMGLYKKVIEAAEKAELDWNIPNIHNRKAFAYLKLGMVDKAKKALSKSLFLYPNFAAGYINRGYILLLEAEKNLKEGKLNLSEKKLDDAFLYYIQGKIWQKEYALPEEKLSYLFHRLEEEKGKSEDFTLEKLEPSFIFFSPCNFYLFILKPYLEPEKPFVIVSLIYIKEGKTSYKEKNLSLKINLTHEGKPLWEKKISNVNLKEGFPCILKLKPGIKPLPGSYKLSFKLFSGEKVLSEEKIEFGFLPDELKKTAKKSDKIMI